MTLEILIVLVLSLVQAMKAFSERAAVVPALRDGKALAATVIAGQALAFLCWRFGWDIASLKSALGTGFGASAGAALIYKALACALGDNAPWDGAL